MKPLFLKSLPKDMFTDFRERGKGGVGERNTDVGKILICRLPHTPDRRLHQQPRYVPWPGIEPAAFFGCTGWCYNQLSHPARAPLFIFYYLHNTWKAQWSSVGEKDNSLSKSSRNVRNNFDVYRRMGKIALRGGTEFLLAILNVGLFPLINLNIAM